MGALETTVDDVARESGFSGVVRVDLPGGRGLERAYGLADRRHGLQMTTDTRLAIASGSKAFTALVVMSLIDDGLLQLSTKARAVLGEDLPLIDDAVTVEHLLSHRSGIGDYLDEDADDLPEYPMGVPVHELASTEQYLPLLAGHPAKFPAGERFCYCNGGFVVLALIAERVAGRPFADLARERVFAPAGLSDTAYLRSDDLPGRAAVGYTLVDNDWRTNVFHLPVTGNGDGGAYSTTADVRRFWVALFGGEILSKRTIANLVTSCGPAPSGAGFGRYGLGFWLHDSGAAVAIEGCDAGVSFRSVHDPVSGRTHTVIGNTTDGAWPLCRALNAVLADEHPRP